MKRGRPPHPDLLTPREQEALSLIREGLTNEQIAERLGISESGARYHVSEILSKLGVASRQEAASWRPERQASAFAAVSKLRIGHGAIGRRLAMAALAAGLIVVLAIALGVAVMRGRSGGSTQAASATPPGPELQDFLALAPQADAVAEAQMPGARLFLVFYGPENIYTFRYTDTDAARDTDIAVDGPHVNDPSPPLWYVSVVQISPDQLGNADKLDLSKLQNAPSAVLKVAGPDLEALAVPFGTCTDHQLIAAVGSQGGQLVSTVNLGCGRFIGSTRPPSSPATCPTLT